MFWLACVCCGFSVLGTPIRGQDKAAAETSLVTFYSTGSAWKSFLGYKHGVFKGRLLDEYDQLAMMSPGTFATFRLDAGPHTFTANSWMMPRPEGGGHLTLDLVAGKHYYIAAYSEWAAVVIFRLENRSCRDAQKDAFGKARPLEQGQLKEYGAAHVVHETTFPECEPATP